MVLAVFASEGNFSRTSTEVFHVVPRLRHSVAASHAAERVVARIWRVVHGGAEETGPAAFLGDVGCSTFAFTLSHLLT